MTQIENYLSQEALDRTKKHVVFQAKPLGLSLADVGSRYRIAQNTLRGRIKKGVLPIIRLGQRRILVLHGDHETLRGAHPCGLETINKAGIGRSVLTLPEIGALLGICRKNVEQLIESDKLPSFFDELGRRLVPAQEFRAWLRSRRTPTRDQLTRCIDLPAPRHGVSRAEAGPLLFLGFIGAFQNVRDAPTALSQWFSASPRSVRTWRNQAKLECDQFGRPVIVASDGYLIRGPGFDAWLDARKANNVRQLRTVSLPIALLNWPGCSPTTRLIAAMIHSENVADSCVFFPSDRLRAEELGVDRATIGKARKLLANLTVKDADGTPEPLDTTQRRGR
jgi:hypothetical protein